MKRNLSMRGFCRLVQVVKYFYRIFALFTLSKLLSMILHLVVCTWSILTDQYRNQWCFTIGFWRVCLFVCLSVCLFHLHRPHFLCCRPETWNVGPLRGWKVAFFWIFEKSRFWPFFRFFKPFFEPPKVEISHIRANCTKFGMYGLCNNIRQKMVRNCEFSRGGRCPPKRGVTSKFYIRLI